MHSTELVMEGQHGEHVKLSCEQLKMLISL